MKHIFTDTLVRNQILHNKNNIMKVHTISKYNSVQTTTKI